MLPPVFGNPNKYWPPLAEANEYHENALLIFLMSSTQLTDVLLNARGNFENSKKQVKYLLEDIHEGIAGTDPGRRPESLSALNMSAIVLITACWESYLETLLRKVFEFLLDSASYEIIPESLKRIVRTEIIQGKDHAFIDQLICQTTEEEDLTDAWKEILKRYVEEKINSFHTLSKEKVNKLFEHTLVLNNLSDCWSWQNRTQENAITQFHKYLNIRHKIVHGNMNKNVVKKDAQDYLTIVEHLVDETEKKVKSHIEELLENQEVSE